MSMYHVVLTTVTSGMIAAAALFGAAAALFGAACDSEVAVDICESVVCTDAPAPICQGQIKVTYQAVGLCHDTGGVAQCEYPESIRQDCTGLGKLCQSGACVDPPVVPCEGITCFEPPAPDCDGDIARVYDQSGTCNPALPPAGACEYGVSGTLDCAASGLICRAGACIDPATIPCDPNPCNVPPLGTCAGNIPQVPKAVGTCTAEGTVAQCDYAPAAVAVCGGGKSCHGGTCATGSRPPAAAGELVITELLRNPVDEDDAGEWFEVRNPTEAALELGGCVIADDGSDSHTIAMTPVLLVPAGGQIVLARTDDAAKLGGFTPDYVYGEDIILGNNADELQINCGGVVIDRVAISGTDWPHTSGVTMSLSGSKTRAADNDQPSAWCDGVTAYGNTMHLGTPRVVNPDCPSL